MLPRQANECMIRLRGLEMEWHSPQALADMADDGFRLVVRSAARIVRSLPSGMGYGFSRLGRVVLFRKQKMVKRPTELAGAGPGRRDAGLTTTVGVKEPRLDKTTLKKSSPDKKTADKGAQCSPISIQTLLNERAPRDKVKAIVLRKALDDLLHGSEGARKSALETLVGLGRDAGTLLDACSREDSPKVVELALEGLRQLGWHCLVSSTSAVLDSSDADLRIIALRAAGRLPDERRRTLLERGLRDSVARVRRRAISYVSWHESSWAVSEIMRLCDDKEADVKWAAVEALMALRPSEACDHLQLMMPSLDPIYRRRAAALLAQQKNSVNKPPAVKVVHKPEKKKPPTPNAPKRASTQTSQGRKRKRTEPKKPTSSDATIGMTRQDAIDKLFVAQTSNESGEKGPSKPNAPRKTARVDAETNDTRECSRHSDFSGKKTDAEGTQKPSSDAITKRNE